MSSTPMPRCHGVLVVEVEVSLQSGKFQAIQSKENFVHVGVSLPFVL